MRLTLVKTLTLIFINLAWMNQAQAIVLGGGYIANLSTTVNDAASTSRGCLSCLAQCFSGGALIGLGAWGLAAKAVGTICCCTFHCCSIFADEDYEEISDFKDIDGVKGEVLNKLPFLKDEVLESIVQMIRDKIPEDYKYNTLLEVFLDRESVRQAIKDQSFSSKQRVDVFRVLCKS